MQQVLASQQARHFWARLRLTMGGRRWLFQIRVLDLSNPQDSLRTPMGTWARST